MPNRRKALIVDDSKDWREELEEFLREKGFEVVTASDRRAALSALDAESFDTAILDVNLTDETLPNRDGLLINRYIQENAPGTRVILISAWPLNSKELADIRPARFIEKSYLWDQLNPMLD